MGVCGLICDLVVRDVKKFGNNWNMQLQTSQHTYTENRLSSVAATQQSIASQKSLVPI